MPGEIIEISGDKESLCFSKESIIKRQWFDSKSLFENKKNINSSEKDILDKLEGLIFNAVKDQSISDVPLGTFLSGESILH